MSRTAVNPSVDYTCPINFAVMFEPMALKTLNAEENGDCTHHFEREAINQWVENNNKPGVNPTCPCCRRPIDQVIPADPAFIQGLTEAYDNTYPLRTINRERSINPI